MVHSKNDSQELKVETWGIVGISTATEDDGLASHHNKRMSAPGPREKRRDEQVRATRNHRGECLDTPKRSGQKDSEEFALED